MIFTTINNLIIKSLNVSHKDIEMVMDKLQWPQWCNNLVAHVFRDRIGLSLLKYLKNYRVAI